MTPLVMFDDARADGWAPFALTRPCGELLFGRWTLRERLERVAGAPVAAHMTRPWLQRYGETGAPPAADLASSLRGATFWNARAVPSLGAHLGAGPANLWVDGALAGARLGADDEPPDAAWFAAPSPLPGLPEVVVQGSWLENPWDLVSAGAERLARDLAATVGVDGETTGAPEGCWKLGSGPIALGDGARVEPGVLFDTREGAIELDAGVEVRTGARLAGPLYAGPRSRLLGGSISSFACGPLCNIRGEIEKVTALGYSNKAHDGFLGHAYVGRWVNLGAMTTNSDLKNNYGTIRVGPSDAQVDTGLLKLGCLIGDHTKTGIGVLLNTGTVVGAGSNLFGAELPPKWVPPFSWGQGDSLVVYRQEAFVSTAATVAARRGVEADEQFRGWLEDVWDEARGG